MSVTQDRWGSCWSAVCCGAASSHPPQIAAIRELTRYRKKLIESRTRELQRLSKVLEDGGIKIHSGAALLEGPHAACGMTWPA